MVAVVAVALAAVGVVVVAAGRVVVVASDVVDGGAARLETKACCVVLTPTLKSDGMRVELPERHDVEAGCGSGDEGLVLAVEASDDGGDDVLITHGATDGSKLVSVGADLGEVVHHGEVFLLEDRHVQLDLHNTGTAMGLVHLFEMLPDGTRCGKPMHLLKNFVDEGGEQVAEDDLVLTEPGGVLRIGSTDALIIGGKQPIGRELGAIDIASGIGDAKGRKDLGFPGEKVGGGELGGDQASGRGRHGGSRRAAKGCRQREGG